MDQGLVSASEARDTADTVTADTGAAGSDTSSQNGSKKSLKKKAVLTGEIIDSIVVNEVDEITRSFEATIPALFVEAIVNKEVDKKVVSARIKGFRPGKAPKEMVRRFYSDGLRSEAMYSIIEEVIEAVTDREAYTPYGSPKVDILSTPPAEDLKFSVKVELYPAPTITGISGLTVKVKKDEVSTDDVEHSVMEYLKSKATLTEIEGRDNAINGDVVECIIRELQGDDSESQSTIGAETVVVGLGQKELPEEFESTLLTMKVGESRVIEIKGKGSVGETADNDETEASDAEQAWPRARRFNVTLGKLSSRELPELTDEFAQSLNLKGVNSVDELKADIAQRLERAAGQRRKEAVRTAVLEKLESLHSFKVPAEMVDNSIRSMIRSSGVFDTKLIEGSFDISLFRDALAVEAEKQVKKAVIVDRVATQEELVPSKEDIDKLLAARAEQYNVPEDVARRFFMSEERAYETVSGLIREKVYDFLESQAKVEFE